jgi:two-component system sensor histidine kinase UhpB
MIESPIEISIRNIPLAVERIAIQKLFREEHRMMDAEWLPIIMQGSFSEIYVIDCATLRFVHANPAALENLPHAPERLPKMTLADIVQDVPGTDLERMLRPLRDGRVESLTIPAKHARKDSAGHPVDLRLYSCASAKTPVFIAIAEAIGARHASALVSNTPCLIFELSRNARGALSFPFLSPGCHALLGMSADALRANPAAFLDLVLPEDRQSCADTLAASARDMTVWNWEGRVHIAEWNDVKWINIRAAPRVLSRKETLWDGTVINITQSKRERADYTKSRDQLAELSAHVQMVKENERMRIARELHDDLGGNLTAIKMAVAVMARRLPADDSELPEKAAYVDSLVDRTIEAVHRISADLRPSILDLGIVAAIGWQAKEFEKQFGIPCAVSSNKDEIELGSDHATTLFRIFQEAVTNVGKHAKASRVAVRLARTNRSISLEVTDDGRGIRTVDRLKSTSFGIRGMEERADALGGKLTVAGASGGGTVVKIRIPVADA